MRKAMQCLLLLAVSCAAALAVGQQTPREEQRHFRSADAKMMHPVELPAEIMAALRQDGDVANALTAAKISAARLPASWFTASVIHTEAGGVLMVVEAERPLFNEYETKFWIFDQTTAGFVLVLDDLGRELEVGSGGTHPVIHVAREHYEIYPTTSYRWKNDHYGVIVVK